jgi:hypothetical protein
MSGESFVQRYIESHEYKLNDYAPQTARDRLAVIIETRDIPSLPWVLRNIAHHTGWQILGYCSDENIHRFDQAGFAIELRKIKLSSVDAYSTLLCSDSFWEDLPEHALIFQSDSFMLRSGIEPFLKYDYVGAPWKWAYELPNRQVFQGGGNGGFSLRKTSKMREIIRAIPHERLYDHIMIKPRPKALMHEDLYFTLAMKTLGCHLPDLETQKRFCVEAIFYEKPLAVHAVAKHLNVHQLRALFEAAE